MRIAIAAKRFACVGRNMHIVELPRVHVSVDVLADILQANQAVDFDCPLQQVLSNARATSASNGQN